VKNIQIIDDAINCTYDIFAIDESIFCEIFLGDQDVEFEDDLFKRLGEIEAKKLLSILWDNRVDKKLVSGIHGTLFFGYCCDEKRPFYPTKIESEMVANP